MIHIIPSAHEWYFNVLKMKKSSSVQSSDFNAYVSFVVINTQQREVVYVVIWPCPADITWGSDDTIH